jgi:sigma-B regulation protein RsbU (phosphoserine phosphatase)
MMELAAVQNKPTRSRMNGFPGVRWLGNYWFRLELALLLSPVFVYYFLSDFDGTISFRGLLRFTFLLGNMSAVFLLLTSRLYRRGKNPQDRILFYCLCFVGASIPDLISGAVSASKGGMLAYDFAAVMGAHGSMEKLVGLLLVLTILISLYEWERMSLRHRELQAQVQMGRVKEQSHEAELTQAYEIQRHLLPRDTPQIPGFKIACAWQPAKSVSGDYFDVLPLGEGRLGLCIADVSGKGITAALLMANLQASVKAFAPEAGSPAILCAKLNQVLCESVAPGKFVTFFYGVIDAKKKQLCYENAGHCLPVLIRSDGTVEMPASYSGVLGVFTHWTFQDTVVQVRSGDCMVLLTDGVLEAADAHEQEFGYRRLIDVVTRHRAAGVLAIREAIMQAVSEFCAGKFDDDASLIVLTVD